MNNLWRIVRATITTTDTTPPVEGETNQNAGANNSGGSSGGGGGCTYSANMTNENQIGILLSILIGLLFFCVARKYKFFL